MLTDLDFNGSAAVVTGGGAGIGQASCLALAELNAVVHVVDKDEGALEETATLLQKMGASHHTHLADVSIESDVAQFARALTAHGVGIKALVNIAGTNDHVAIQDATLERWETLLRVNLTSMFLMTKAMLPFLAKEPGGRSVVNMASSLGLIGNPSTPAYCASKAGVLGLTRQLAVDFSLQDLSIRVNAVCPGPTVTPRRLRYFQQGLKDPGPNERQTLVKRQAEPREIANVIAFLASDASSFMDGASVVVDGGQTVHTGTME